MGENKNTLLVTLLVIFIVLTILLGGYIVYDKLVLAKNNSTVDNTTDNKIEAITYTLKKEMIGSTVSHYADWDKVRDSESFKIEDENGDLYLTYPVINGNTSDIINLNDTIKKHIEDNYRYGLNRKLDDIRSDYKFDVSCKGSVPESIIAFWKQKIMRTQSEMQCL